MKQFDDWLESSHISPKTAFKCHAGLEAAYRAGMLAAADIAERMYFFHTPDDGVISGDGIADEIRKKTKERNK